MTTSTELYTESPAMEPLLPETIGAMLSELTCKIFRASGQLLGQVHSPVTLQGIACLVREMNSYYSNLIEGHRTLPREIEQALRNEYSADPKKRANQHLARAHVEVEQLMHERLAAEPDLSIHSAGFLCWIHGEFYRRIPSEYHLSQDRSGKDYRIMPGTLRDFEVTVGKHQPPHYGSLHKLLARFEDFYGNREAIPPTHQLVALAAAHHRLSWIHPFGDGNGRVARLYSHAWLIRCKVDASGLWSLSRGLARNRASYYAHLHSADSRRANDFDGRGNLSERALADFCVFFMQTMLDQIEFMSGCLQLDTLATRMTKYIENELPGIKRRQRERLIRLLPEVLVHGEIERGRVASILGLSTSAAREITRLALEKGLLTSPSEKAHKGPLSLNFSAQTLESYFPRLFLPTDTTP